MKKKSLFYVILVVSFVFIMPFGVFAKEYSFGDIWNEYLPLVEGDTVDISDPNIGFCEKDVRVYLRSIEYNESVYSFDGYGVFIDRYTDLLKYDYKKWVLEQLNKMTTNNTCLEKRLSNEDSETIDICPGSEEYNKLVNYVQSKLNKPTFMLDFSFSTLCYLGIDVFVKYSDESKEKILLNIGYLNVFNASKNSIEANPVSYVKEDGTIVLKDLERVGYNFEGWYLDKKYQFRVRELTQELVDDYFSGSGHFSDIEKAPVEEVDGELVGKIDLYAKWSSNNVVTNPQTSSVVGIVAGVLFLVIIACSYIFIIKKKENV